MYNTKSAWGAMKEDQERTPLRTILTNFLNHIENLEARRSSEDSYESEFQELKLFSESIKGTKQFSCSEGEKEVNRKKNRYKDILPFDISRVSLIEYAGIPGSDYINANFIKGASGSPAYIASQGPLPHTVNDFWRMVVQCEVQVIVMACNEEEAGKHKCENYWVEEDGEEKQFGMVSIRLIKASTVCPDFSVRTMRLKYTNSRSVVEERTVCQFHYSAWPDHGVPPLVRPLLDMVRLVRDTQASETLPVLVHCSAGCGRTGTICAIDYVWGLLRAGKLTKDFSLLSLVREMRKQRIAMVQTKEQYVLVHQAVRELFKEQLRMIDSHPYENIDSNGLPLIKSPCPESEPTYDTVSTYHLNNTSEEKQDEKEKETIAPPIPQKKKFILSSKQEKEVENLSERQRLVEQAESSSESIGSSNASGTSSGHRPRIAKLKSFFERNSATRESRRGPHVSRSHSLGAVRNTKPNPSLVNSESASVDKEFKEIVVKENPQPIPHKGILRVPQAIDQPALPVKRSKSLRILGTGDRYKLSIPAGPPTSHEIDISNSIPDRTRRLSLESNIDEMRETERNLSSCHEFNQLKNSKDSMPAGVVDAIVAGLGVRERRNSFRQAMNRAGPEQTAKNRKDREIIWSTPHRRPGLLRSYTSIDMRTVHAQSVRQNLASIAGSAKMDKSNSAPSKPLLRPKPFVYNSGTSKPLDKSTDANKFASNSFYPSKSNTQQSNQNTSLNHFLNTPITSLQNNPRPVPRLNRLTEVKPNIVSKQAPPSSNYSSRPDLTRQKDLSYPFKTEYINANRAKILHPVGHSIPTSCSGGISTQIDINHTKSSLVLRDVPQKQFPLDSRFSENSKVVRTLSSSPRNNDQSVCNQLVNTNKPIQDSIQNINSRHNRDHSSVEHKSNESKSLLQSYELQSQQNFRQIQQGTTSSPKTHLEMIRKNSSKQQFQSPSTSRPIVYDSRSGKQDAVAIYGTRPKAPPPYLEASRQNMYNRTQINPRKTSNFDYDHRYNARCHLSKMHHDSRQIQQDSVQARDSSQFYTVKHNSSQTDDRVKGMEIREVQNYNQFNKPQFYSHKVIQEMKSNPQSSHDTMVHEIKSNQETVYDNRVPEAKSNPSPLQETRTHEMRSNILHLQDSRAHEMRSNEPLQDSRIHEVKSNTPLHDRVHEMRSNPPVLQNFSSKTTQGTKIYEFRSNPPLQDDRQGKQQYLHHSSSRNQQVEPVYRSDKPQPIDDRSNAEPESGNLSVKLRRGSRDDLALCSNFSTPSRVKRHASVVMLRHSLIENSNSSGSEGQQAAMPLTVWNQGGGKESRNTDVQGGQFTNKCDEDPWSGAVGIDLDHVAASIPLKDGTSTKYMRAALESLHLRKGTAPQAIENVETKPSNSHTVNSQSSQSAQNFRKQQQYL